MNRIAALGIAVIVVVVAVLAYMYKTMVVSASPDSQATAQSTPVNDDVSDRTACSGGIGAFCQKVVASTGVTTAISQPGGSQTNASLPATTGTPVYSIQPTATIGGNVGNMTQNAAAVKETMIDTATQLTTMGASTNAIQSVLIEQASAARDAANVTYEHVLMTNDAGETKYMDLPTYYGSNKSFEYNTWLQGWYRADKPKPLAFYGTTPVYDMHTWQSYWGNTINPATGNTYLVDQGVY